MDFMKKFLNICALILLCVITGSFFANFYAKPIFLTDEEILYYTNVAETAWYDGLSSIKEYKDIDVESNLQKREVHIIPFDKNKQSLTIKFSDNTQIVTINKPVVSFWGIFIFYGIYFGLMSYVFLAIAVYAIKFLMRSYRKKRSKKEIY